jgi:O-antigen/teichoic acid export membrane protein
MIKAVQLVSLPTFAVLYFLSDELLWVLPECYAGISEPLRYLCIFGITGVFLRELTPALYAINRLRWIVWRSLLFVFLMAALIAPLYRRLGIAGVCWAVNIAMVVSVLFLLAMTLRELHWPWRQWLTDMAVLWKSLAAGVVGFLVVFGILALAGRQWSANSLPEWLCVIGGLTGYTIFGWRGYVRAKLMFG